MRRHNNNNNHCIIIILIILQEAKAATQAGASAGDPKTAAAAANSSVPRFEIKKWNAVAMWSWDICADTVRYTCLGLCCGLFYIYGLCAVVEWMIHALCLVVTLQRLTIEIGFEEYLVLREEADGNHACVSPWPPFGHSYLVF